MMFFLLLFVPGLNRAQAQAPSVSYAGPLTITQGGTYSGNYRSTDSNVPVITIQTTQPVIIENCILAGAGDLIDAKNGGSDLVVRNNQGFGLTQSVDNRRHGRFIEVNSGKSVRIEHNYFEHTTGIDIYQWGGPGSLVIRYNKAKNMDGRFRNGGGEYCNFLGINGAFNIAGAEVAWNEVLNEPNQSLVEDNINLYNSSGTSNSPFRLHDNYVQGAYPYPATGSNYTGSGITMDGDGSSAGTTTAYVDGYGNQLVSTCAAMNIAAGHDNHFHDNRMVTSGLLPDGSKMPAGYAAAGLWNAYQQPGSVFYNNDFNNNTIGFYYQGGNTPYANRQDTSPGACNPCSNTNHLPDRPLTLDDEKYEWTLWQQKLQQNGITLGTGSNTPPPSNTPPTVSLSVPATGTVGTALTLSATAADADGTVAKVEFFSGATKLGEDLTSPYALSYTPTAAATMSFSARATDNAGAATSSAASSVSISATAPAGGGGTAPPTGTPANATFLRALNVGGGTATIDGKTWEDGTTAANFQINGGAFSNQTVTLSPATDAARATMIRSSVYNPALSATVSNVTNGTYFVYLYMWEDNNPETYDISVEGQVVKSGYNSGAAGHWDRLGPFTANVTDTNISIATTGGDANLSGIEIWKQSTTTPSNTPPTASLTAPATGTVNTALTLSATAADADGTVAKVEFFSGATKLGEDLTSPYSLSWTPTTAGTFSLTARATDNAGAATNSAAVSVTVSATAPAATAGFYRAINVNGSAVSLDGNSWQGSTATNYTTNGAGFSNQNVALNPATTTARAGMIRSSVYTNALSFKMTSVPNGTYDVYLYVWEDNNPETFSIAVNGVAAVSNFNSGSAGSWKKLGPYAATVTAGTISITSTGGTINLSGVEVWRKSTSTALVLPTATEAAATAKATASASAYPASLANSLALNGVAPQAATMQAATLNQGGTTVRSALVRAARGASAKQPASQALPADQYYLRYTNSSLAGPPKGSIS